MSFQKFVQMSICLLVSSTLLVACSKSPEPESARVSEQKAAEVSVSSATEPPPGQLDRSVEPVLYSLELKIDPSQDLFSGTTSIDVAINTPTELIWLHGKDLDVSEVYLIDSDSNRIEASYDEKLDSGVALVSFAETVNAGDATLHFVYTAPFNSSVNALFKVERGGEFYAASQLESTGARQVFPGFDDPGFKVPFDLTIISKEDDATITSTPEVEAEELGDGFVRHSFARTRPLPTYLLAFAVGPYDVVEFGMLPANSIRDREVPLRGITAKGLGPRINYALENTPEILGALEEYFGTPYPYAKLDLIAVPESFGGAMENPGAITYDEYLILMDENSPASQRRTYTDVHAHELAHMWFGNLVTPVWWNDIWLNEAFATWMMYKASDAYWPEGEFDRETQKGALDAMSGDSLVAAREIRQPIARNEEIAGAFDGITYQKGGGVLKMLERFVGEEAFKEGVRLHMERHKDDTSTAEDFIDSLATGSGHSEINAAFKSYIEQSGVPLIAARVNCEDEQRPLLEVSQTRYAPLGSAIDPHANTWNVPMCVSYLADGSQKNTCAMLSERSQTIELEADSCPTQLHPNADGAGYYRFTMDGTWWDGLLANSADLAPAEALALADSLDAAFRAGVVPAKTYVGGLSALLNHDSWDVVDAAMGNLEKISSVIDVDHLGPVENAFRALVGPKFDQLADATDTGSKLLRQRMQRFLIVIAKDAEMREPLALQAAASIGLNGEPDADAAPASELETIYSIGVQDIGAPFFDLLLEQAIATQDPTFRNSATGALARVEDPILVAKLQQALIDGAFKGTDFVGILFRQMARAATTELTYEWFKANDEAVIKLIPESFRSSMVPALGGAFCSLQRADDWQAFVESHGDKLPGYERELAQATEEIRLCAALKQAKEAELITAFSAYGQ